MSKSKPVTHPNDLYPIGTPLQTPKTKLGELLTDGQLGYYSTVYYGGFYDVNQSHLINISYDKTKRTGDFFHANEIKPLKHFNPNPPNKTSRTLTKQDLLELIKIGMRTTSDGKPMGEKMEQSYFNNNINAYARENLKIFLENKS